MDEGTLGFVVRKRYLGVAFRGLQGLRLFAAVSSVWGQGILHMRYVGGSHGESLSYYMYIFFLLNPCVLSLLRLKLHL